MPGTAFKRIGAKWKSDLNKIVDLPHAFVKQQMVWDACAPVISLMSKNVDFSFASLTGFGLVFPLIHLRLP